MFVFHIWPRLSTLSSTPHTSEETRRCKSRELTRPPYLSERNMELASAVTVIQLSFRWEGPRADRKPNTRPPSSWITGLRHESRPTTNQSVSHTSVPSSLDGNIHKGYGGVVGLAGAMR
ncbi:hypothetical protein J6590_011601 [Homalodisca vitripennis]|nr:hypothetical protein J6590_011601 [Homalodisca vitripennis]